MTAPAAPPEVAPPSVTDGGRAGRARIRSLGASVAAVLLALITGGVLLAIAGADPITSYADVITGTFGSRFDISLLLTEVVPLVIVGLGLAVAFRSRVWNIGAEGQFVIGALVGGAFALNVPIANPVIMVALVGVVAATAGAGFGWIVGFLRARWNVNEVISSLLLNYIGIFTLNYAVRKPLRDPVGFQPVSESLPDVARLPDVPGFRVHIGLLVALTLVPLVAYVIRRTPFGFHTLMMGLNPDATAAAGVKTSRLVTRVMMISGGLAGLAGVVQVMGIEGRLTNNLAAGFGFTAIIVALMGRLRPVGVLLAAILIGTLTVGGDVIQRTQDVPRILMLVIQALFVLFLLVADKLGRR